MRCRTAIALISICFAIMPASALAECSFDLAKVEKAAQSSSWQDAEVLALKVENSIACETWEKRKAKGLLSQRLVSEAKKIDPNLKNASAISYIEKAANLNADWHTLELFGKLQRSAGRFQAAATSFQSAIDLIADWNAEKSDVPAGAWKNEANPSERVNLAAEADEAKHLAAAEQGVLVAASTDRDGNPGGVFSAAVDRGAVGIKVPAPILFEYNSAQLTRVGGEAAIEIANFLKDRNPKSITVTGHTDHVGSEAYNMDLSTRRAATVVAFLKEKGIAARIVTVGKGFSEPRKLSQGTNYTQSQIDELNRRVEFDWN